MEPHFLGARYLLDYGVQVSEYIAELDTKVTFFVDEVVNNERLHCVLVI